MVFEAGLSYTSAAPTLVRWPGVCRPKVLNRCRSGVASNTARSKAKQIGATSKSSVTVTKTSAFQTTSKVYSKRGIRAEDNQRVRPLIKARKPGPSSGWANANSTLACKNPSLLPQSKRLPS